jgi:hypothetical protein
VKPGIDCRRQGLCAARKPPATPPSGILPQVVLILSYSGALSPTIIRWLKETIRRELGALLQAEIRVVTVAELDAVPDGEVFCDRVCQGIRTAAVRVIDISYDNTNVGYELALCQNSGRPAFITMYRPRSFRHVFAKRGISRRIPTDINQRDVHIYGSQAELGERIRQMAPAMANAFREANKKLGTVQEMENAN